MSWDLNDDKLTLVQAMAWCRQATSHYLSQCWPRSMLPYGVNWPRVTKEVDTSWLGYESFCTFCEIVNLILCHILILARPSMTLLYRPQYFMFLIHIWYRNWPYHEHDLYQLWVGHYNCCIFCWTSNFVPYSDNSPAKEFHIIFWLWASQVLPRNVLWMVCWTSDRWKWYMIISCERSWKVHGCLCRYHCACRWPYTLV